MHLWEHLLERQYRRPRGLLGGHVGRSMARDHRPENLWTVGLLEPAPGDHILELGFGPGIAIAELARRVPRGWIAGVDYSRTMLRAAGRRNARAVREGRVSLHLGEAGALPFADATFDKAYGIHIVYFWPQPLAALREIRRVLRPGGLLALTMLPRERMPGGGPAEGDSSDFHAYSGAALGRLLREAGFQRPRIVADTAEEHLSNYTILAWNGPA